MDVFTACDVAGNGEKYEFHEMVREVKHALMLTPGAFCEPGGYQLLQVLRHWDDIHHTNLLAVFIAQKAMTRQQLCAQLMRAGV